MPWDTPLRLLLQQVREVVVSLLIASLAFFAAGLALLAGLLVTHRPELDDPDPYDQPHREVVPWP